MSDSGLAADPAIRVDLLDVAELERRDDWKRVVRGGPPQLSARWLAAYRDSFGRTQRCAIARGTDGAPLAGCVFHVRHPGDHHRKYDLAPVLAAASPPVGLRGSRCAARPTAVVVAPSSYAPGLYRTDTTAAGVRAVGRLLDAVAGAAAKEGAGAVFLPHLHPADAVAIAETRRSAVTIPGDRIGYLDLSADRSFEDYLARFRADRRQRIRQDRRKFAAAGLAVEVRRDLSFLNDLDRMVERQCAHYVRHGISPDPHRVRGQFESLARSYGTDMIVIDVLRDGHVVGHVVVLAEGDWLVPRLAGFDEGVRFGYFEAGYYTVIELAVGELGCRLVDYGGAAIEAKRLRGCTIRETTDIVEAIG